MTETATLFLVIGLIFLFVVTFVQWVFDIQSIFYYGLFFVGGHICTYADAPLSVVIPLVVVTILLGGLAAGLYRRIRNRTKDDSD